MYDEEREGVGSDGLRKYNELDHGVPKMEELDGSVV